VIRRALTAYRANGVRGVCFGVLAWTRLYRRLELVVLALDPPPPLLETPLELEFSFLAATADEDETSRVRRARGDRCFVAREHGAIVSSRWIAEQRAYVGYLDLWLELEPDEVFLSETYTEPSRRGRGVSGAAGTRLAHALAVEGRRRILAGVLPENRAGRRAYEKAGYVGGGRIGYVRLGPWRRTFTR
jgi:RimJ/RimL family protein N-acetyltransferase